MSFDYGLVRPNSRMINGRMIIARPTNAGIRKPSTKQQRLEAIAKRRGVSSTTQQAIRTGGWANPTRGGELKFKDTALTLIPVQGGTAFTAPNAPSLLNGLVPGSSASERIGRKITIKSVLIRWQAFLDPASVGGTPLRIMVFYDKQANAADPAVTDVLLNNQFTSANNLSNRDRFVTIFDNITEVVSTQNNFAIAGTLYKSLNLETMYNAGNAGTIGDISSGSIYIMAAQSGKVTVQPVNIVAQCRVRYTDV